MTACSKHCFVKLLFVSHVCTCVCVCVLGCNVKICFLFWVAVNKHIESYCVGHPFHVLMRKLRFKDLMQDHIADFCQR